MYEDLLKFYEDNGIFFPMNTCIEKTSRELADAANTLEGLKEVVCNFNGCSLKETANNTVFADGSVLSDLMLIGEGPGAQEDATGVPFCGASGKLLDKMFLSIGFDRSNLYITNVVFWRPPGNRNPTQDEIEICLPFLEKHIFLIQPKLIALVGGISASAVLRLDKGISSLRGNIYEYSNQYLNNITIPAMPIFHPSYLMRQPKQKRLAWEDLQKIEEHLHCNI